MKTKLTRAEAIKALITIVDEIRKDQLTVSLTVRAQQLQLPNYGRFAHSLKVLGYYKKGAWTSPTITHDMIERLYEQLFVNPNKTIGEQVRKTSQVGEYLDRIVAAGQLVIIQEKEADGLKTLPLIITAGVREEIAKLITRAKGNVISMDRLIKNTNALNADNSMFCMTIPLGYTVSYTIEKQGSGKTLHRLYIAANIEQALPHIEVLTIILKEFGFANSPDGCIIQRDLISGNRYSIQLMEEAENLLTTSVGLTIAHKEETAKLTATGGGHDPFAK